MQCRFDLADTIHFRPGAWAVEISAKKDVDHLFGELIADDWAAERHDLAVVAGPRPFV
jgi:hypothetical protein